MLEEFLMHIGLSDKEAKVYMSLLKVDDANAAAISKSSNINRTTVYPILESLKHKGLVEEIEKNGKSTFRSNSPEKIETYIEEQKIKLDEQSKVVKDMIPRFKSISRDQGEKPVVEYYNGKEGIFELIKNHWASSDDEGESFMIYPRDEVENFFDKKEIESLRKVRVGKKIKSNSIYTYSKGEYNPDDTGERIRITDPSFTIDAEIDVYKDRIMMYNFTKNQGAILIRSSDFAETLRTLFKLAIKNIKK